VVRKEDKEKLKENITQHSKLVAENFATLALGIFSIALIAADLWARVFLIIFGAIFLMIGIYLFIPCNFKREWFLVNVAKRRNLSIFKYVGWFAILSRFGYDLFSTNVNGLKILGYIIIAVAFIVFMFAYFKND
jgi:hypothetical protein